MSLAQSNDQRTAKMDTLEILRSARALIASEGAHCKGVFYQNRAGVPVSHCVVGAIVTAADATPDEDGWAGVVHDPRRWRQRTLLRGSSEPDENEVADAIRAVDARLDREWRRGGRWTPRQVPDEACRWIGEHSPPSKSTWPPVVAFFVAAGAVLVIAWKVGWL